VLERGEHSPWWRGRAEAIRRQTRKPLRRITVPRETELYGRDEELDQLREAYEQACRGRGRVVLVEGEAGIGKTRLVDEFVARLKHDGEDPNFLFGSYPPGGAATGSGAFSTAYRKHFGSAALEQTLEEYLGGMPVLVPAFAAVLRGEPAPRGVEPLTKGSLQTVFVETTRQLSFEAPTIVLIDDLHFAPDEGRAIFTALALAIPPHRVLLIGTARRTLPDEWAAEVERHAHCRRMTLGRLGPKDLTQLLEDAFRSRKLAEDLGFRIARKSDGNPFFVFEIIRGLREGQFISRRADGTWGTTGVIDEIVIPSSARELIQARIADLDDEERLLLEMATCGGFRFDPSLVAEAVGVGVLPALQTFARIEHRHLLIRGAGRRYVFDHQQVQESLYEQLFEQLREHYHVGLGRALERRMGVDDDDTVEIAGAESVELCEHFLAGGEHARARRYVVPALEHLGRGHLSADAVKLAKRALALPDLLAGTDRFEVLMLAAARLSLLGRPADEQQMLREAVGIADRLGDGAARARAHRALGWNFRNVSRYDRAREELERAIELSRDLGDTSGEGTAAGHLGIVFDELGRYGDALAEHERHLALAQASGNRHDEAIATGNIGLVVPKTDPGDDGAEHHERALEIALELGELRLEATSYGNLAGVLVGRGDFEAARELAEKCVAIAGEIGDRQAEAGATLTLGEILYALGRYEESWTFYQRSHDLAVEMGHRLGEASALLHLGVLRMLLGDAERAKRSVERARLIAHEIAVPLVEADALFRLALIAEQQADLSSAGLRYAEALLQYRDIEFLAGEAETRLALGGLLVSQGRRSEARPHLETALEAARDLEEHGIAAVARAHLALVTGANVGRAEESLQRRERHLGHREKMDAHRVLWRATGRRKHLVSAYRLLQHLMAHAPEECREAMLVNVPLLREISVEWAAHGR
jgi:tetratricopeptide (TPR) repeat protein